MEKRRKLAIKKRGGGQEKKEWNVFLLSQWSFDKEKSLEERKKPHNRRLEDFVIKNKNAP